MTFADASARDAIRHDLGSTLIVEAAAGTGKTTEMIARIVEVIQTGAATLEQIVAVTFTDKAAGEMKLRLRIELENARVEATASIARERFERALAELEVARIGTIHAFCAELLRERPIEAGVDPLFEVAGEDEADRLFQCAFDAWFQAALAAPGDGVRRLLRRNAPIESLRAAGKSLVGRRDFDGRWRRDPFDRDRAIDELIEQLAAHRAVDPATKLSGRIARWIAELGRREGVRGRDHDGLESELLAVARWWEWKPTRRGDAAARRASVVAALAGFRQAADADLAAALHDELRPLVVDYVRLAAGSGQLDFFDLLQRTRDLLRDDRQVRMDYQRRFTRYYVDEFQDVDPLQVEILLLLGADDPAESDPRAIRIAPGRLFVVGDPKQAIYRFRRADVALYEAVKRRLIADGARLVELTTSFRSVPSIQAAVNAAFAPVMRGDGQAAYVALAPVRAEISDQPTIVALPVPRPYGKQNISNKEIERSYPDAVGAFLEWAIASSGWTIVRGASRVALAPRDVCLMFRRFQSFGADLTRPYVRALEARQIPHVLVGGRSFHDREEIEAARSALAAIEWPDDELSVYATLRGPLFAFHDEDLLAFKHALGDLHPLRWREPESRGGSQSEPTGRSRQVAVALSILAELHVERNRRPIADTFARLLGATRAHAGFAMWPAGEQALANVLRIMDLARRFEARGATSFRAFVDKLAADVERGRQPDAIVVEDATEGVRIMTAHAAKGLEFPVVILCDPTAPLAQDRPSRYVDATRRVWLEPIAGCVPIELREHAEHVHRRDLEEGQRLAYVATTRARDLLVVPVVGDERRDNWLSALAPVVHPAPARRRDRAIAIACPRFGDDSVLSRGPDTERTAEHSVSPGLHAPQAGTHAIVWWDPRVLDLERSIVGGMRQRQVLETDASGELAAESSAAHAAWQERRATALVAGMVPSLEVRTITEAARTANAGWSSVAYEDTGIDRADRPRGQRFGVLVHAVLAAVDLHADASAIRAVAIASGRLVGAAADEVDAAVVAVAAALGHPLLARAARAGALRREVPVVLNTSEGMLEGVVDLAFEEAGMWTVVDFKTDAELDGQRVTYEMQVRLYATAIAEATGRPTSAALLIV